MSSDRWEREKDGQFNPSSADTQPPGRRFADLRKTAMESSGPLSLTIYPQRPGMPERIAMAGDQLVIGREEGDIQIEDLLVSRRHALIERVEGGALVVRDLDSTNGTFLNGALLLAPSHLRDGDDIRIGPAHLRVHIGSE